MNVSGRDTLKGFKGPFKGKGGAERRLEELEIEIVAVRERMKNLVARYKATFRAPAPAYLTTHSREAGVAVRWRTRGRNGRQYHFDLLDRDSDHARIFLRVMPRETWPVLLQFEMERLALNLEASLAEHERRRVRAYIAAMHAARQFEKSALDAEGGFLLDAQLPSR